MKRLAIAGLVIVWLLTTAGMCAHDLPAPVILTRTADVPVPTKCAVAVPAAPDYPDTDAALRAAGPAGDPSGMFRRVVLLSAGRLLRIAHEAQLAAALGGCTGETGPY